MGATRVCFCSFSLRGATQDLLGFFQEGSCIVDSLGWLHVLEKGVLSFASCLHALLGKIPIIPVDGTKQIGKAKQKTTRNSFGVFCNDL